MTNVHHAKRLLDEAEILIGEALIKIEQARQSLADNEGPIIKAVIPGDPPAEELTGHVCEAVDLGRAVDRLKPGETLNVKPGVYYGTISPRDAKGATIRAIEPGTVRISGLWPAADQGKVRWKEKWGAWCAPHGDSFLASAGEAFLFRYRSVDELKAKEIMGHKKPDYGYAYKDGHIFLRLPDGSDPNGQSIKMCDKPAQAIVRVERSPGLKLDGFVIEAAGDKDAVRFDEQSEAPIIENCVFTHSRRAARIPHRATILDSEYSYVGFWSFYLDLIKLNGEGSAAMFDLVKKVWTKPGSGNSAIEGGFIESAHKGGSEGVVLKRLFMHSVFDGNRLGACKSVDSSSNVYWRCLDNSFESEHHLDSINANIHEHDSLILDSPAALCSHQDTNNTGMHGKHYVSNCIIANREVSAPFLIKLLNVQNDIVYAHCQFEIKAGKDENWGKMAALAAGMRGQAVPSKLKLYNNVVTGDEPTPMKGSPTIVGVAKERGKVEAKDVPAKDRGPIKAHAFMGPDAPDDLTDWPRPMRTVFNR